ncbi:Vi polysaccharide biosynthesis UDP-N-acetylglucosamine C-6 dehydrogenase TviB [Candidatus Pelagibacter sp. HIMB1587]|uniref:Vi polysaccharide biosynthesis UDP-N-acetylglucosamine C-6 dehydrogenase TviB n=1 Tax=Candidatus Pelagibacter sp. HIMB1587 TaxID=3413354 RepID=UPI003F82CAF2
MKNSNEDLKLAIIGLGYVGLPLALEFSKKKNVIGFDINKTRIKELKSGIDKNLEFNKDELNKYKRLKFTNSIKNLKSVNCFIITVPTPVDELKKPNLMPLLNATEMIGKALKKEDLIIYESTVYPGCIEEECVPILEKISGLKFNQDFFCGYSPERINPGDKKHTISKIKKITSGSTPQVSKLVDDLYNEIITAGTHKAPSIKVAEAAKVIENTQRDLNIALVNELSIIFSKLKIDTEDVLKAAESKWNFLSFKPGLVGGHCIGVDPYYLTYKAKKIGYHPEIILSGRKINDNMGNHVALNLIREFKKKKIKIKGSKILIMGLTFKENCSDVRNSGVKSVVDRLKKYNCSLDLYDPWANEDEIKKIYGRRPISILNNNKYDGILLAVAHKKFLKIGEAKIINLCKKNHVIYDLKYLFSKKRISLRL